MLGTKAMKAHSDTRTAQNYLDRWGGKYPLRMRSYWP
jgi:hypothetical protein